MVTKKTSTGHKQELGIEIVNIAEELRIRNKIEMARNLSLDRIATSLEKIVALIPPPKLPTTKKDHHE